MRAPLKLSLFGLCLDITGDAHRGRQGQSLAGGAGHEVREHPVGTGLDPLPVNGPGAVGIAFGVDVPEVLAVGAHHDQVQLLLMLQIEVRHRCPRVVADDEAQLASLTDPVRCTHIGESEAALRPGQAERGRPAA